MVPLVEPNEVTNKFESFTIEKRIMSTSVNTKKTRRNNGAVRDLRDTIKLSKEATAKAIKESGKISKEMTTHNMPILEYQSDSIYSPRVTKAIFDSELAGFNPAEVVALFVPLVKHKGKHLTAEQIESGNFPTMELNFKGIVDGRQVVEVLQYRDFEAKDLLMFWVLVCSWMNGKRNNTIDNPTIVKSISRKCKHVDGKLECKKKHTEHQLTDIDLDHKFKDGKRGYSTGIVELWENGSQSNRRAANFSDSDKKSSQLLNQFGNSWIASEAYDRKAHKFNDYVLSEKLTKAFKFEPKESLQFPDFSNVDGNGGTKEAKDEASTAQNERTIMCERCGFVHAAQNPPKKWSDSKESPFGKVNKDTSDEFNTVYRFVDSVSDDKKNKRIVSRWPYFCPVCISEVEPIISKMIIMENIKQVPDDKG